MNIAQINSIQDVLSLDSVLYEERANLPKVSGIYFAVSSGGILEYVGKSRNIKQRWKNHSRDKEFSLIDQLQIYWVLCAEGEIHDQEIRLIEKLKPVRNGTKVTYPAKKIEGPVFRPEFDLRTPSAGSFVSRLLRQPFIIDKTSVEVGGGLIEGFVLEVLNEQLRIFIHNGQADENDLWLSEKEIASDFFVKQSASKALLCALLGLEQNGLIVSREKDDAIEYMLKMTEVASDAE